jgi:hypothetical protein
MNGRESLEQKFYRFVQTLPDAERLDDVQRDEEQERAEKADVFFRSRRIVCEVKSLLTDTSNKIDPIIEPQRSREDFPQFYGEWPIGDILSRLPDGELLRRRLYESTSSAVKEFVRKANRQIRETKRTFGLPGAGGLLVVLNDAVEVLNPDVVAHRVVDTLRKRNPDRSLQFPEINGVWIISERHLARIEGKPMGYASVPLTNSDSLHPEVTAFIDSIQQPWAAFNNLPLVEVPASEYASLKFDAAPKPATITKVTLSEWSRRMYTSRPYLRAMADDELLEYGGRLTDELSLLSGAPDTPPHARVRATKRWADLNEEMNARRMDIRALQRQRELPASPVFDSHDFLELFAVLADSWDIVVDPPRRWEFD